MEICSERPAKPLLPCLGTGDIVGVLRGAGLFSHAGTPGWIYSFRIISMMKYAY